MREVLSFYCSGSDKEASQRGIDVLFFFDQLNESRILDIIKGDLDGIDKPIVRDHSHKVPDSEKLKGICLNQIP